MLLVVLGLKSRTILNRIGLKTRAIAPKSPSALTAKKSFKDHDLVFSEYSSRNRQVRIGENGVVHVLDRCFNSSYFLNCKSINKDDYLYIYTFFYLDLSLSDLKRINLSEISLSNVSKEPFVQSQQIFNLISNYNSIFTTDLNNYLYEQYKDLCRNIEYKIDGNHVIENLLSICLYEIYFEDSSSNLKMLAAELSRQIDKHGHLERNTKYTYDILLKLKVLDKLLDAKCINHQLKVFIETLKNSLIKYYDSSFFSHDNIQGDNLYLDLTKLLKRESKWMPTDLIKVRSASGMSGHSFDCSYFAPLPTFIRCFGTYHYANTAKRRFQRMRINNAQLCLEKKDQSIWFWKSFRVLFKLPKFSFKINEITYVAEFIKSNNMPRILFYKWESTNNGWTYKSPNKFFYKIYIDQLPEITKSEIILSNHKFIFPRDSSVSVKSTVRASGLGVLKKTYSIMIKSSSLTLTKI